MQAKMRKIASVPRQCVIAENPYPTRLITGKGCDVLSWVS